MPAVQRSEFSLALNQVANERGVDVDVVLETVRNAILAAYRKDHAGVEVEDFRAELNPNTGEAKIFQGDKDVTPPGFGRIAAQTAKQVILQKIREKEKEAIFTDYRVKIGTVINGMVLRFAGVNVIVDIGKTEAIMPLSEQVPNEKYHLNQRLAFYLVDIREGIKGDEIVVSRAANGLVEGLFKREVPEIAQGSVEIKSVVREPGNRSKVAVFSVQPGIDPVGSCVGQKGVRVQAIIQELGGLEKVDIIQWAEDTKTYIAQALSPAKNVTVEVDEEAKVARVKVPTDELSLAIGKEGQNVRLAHKLTGYRIEIEGTQPSPEASAGQAESDTAQAQDTEASKDASSVTEVTDDKEVKTDKSAEEKVAAEKVSEEKEEKGNEEVLATGPEAKTDEAIVEEKAAENIAVEPAPVEEMTVEAVEEKAEENPGVKPVSVEEMKAPEENSQASDNQEKSEAQNPKPETNSEDQNSK